MANLKCAACGFEEGERRFTPIQIGNSSVSLKESQGVNSASFKLTPVTLVCVRIAKRSAFDKL